MIEFEEPFIWDNIEFIYSKSVIALILNTLGWVRIHLKPLHRTAAKT